jgi:hypothetical protein
MKWTLIKQVNQADHWLLEDTEHPVELRYNSQARSFWLNTGQRRLYFLERTGFFQSKMLIAREYNVHAGECYFIRNRFAGILQIENNKYEFKVSGDHIKLSLKNKLPFGHITIKGPDTLDNFEFVALLFAFANLQQTHFKNGEVQHHH